MDPASSPAQRPPSSALFGHVLLPALAPLAMIALACTPVTLIGCVNRGWIAFGLALGSMAVAAFATTRAFRTRSTCASTSRLWILTALLLLLPAVLLLGPLG